MVNEYDLYPRKNLYLVKGTIPTIPAVIHVELSLFCWMFQLTIEQL